MTEVLTDFCLLKLDAMIELVEGLPDEVANARPAAGANSPYALLSHCLGMCRHWSARVNRGIEVPRDRAAEFTAAGPVAELVARARVVREEFASDCLLYTSRCV